MIVEHEVIEQIEESADGRPLDWVCTLIRLLGKAAPLTVLEQMCRAGYITLADPCGDPLPVWRRERVWRDGDESLDVRVVATPLGSEWVHG